MRFASTSRRRAAAFVFLFVLIVPVLVACGGTAPTGPAATSAPEVATAAPASGDQPTAVAQPTAATAEQPTAAPSSGGDAGATGGTLKILYWQAPTSLNGHQGSGTKDLDASGVILEPLAAWGPDGVPVPKLAAEIPTVQNGGISTDLKTVTWKLKKGVKWSDGSDFTSDDVKFTWEYCADPATACVSLANFQPIEKIDTPDPTTVVITWKTPNPNSYISFLGYSGYILQRKQFKDCVGAAAGECPANNAPIGTGGYKLKEFKPGDTVIYERNPLYRDADKVGFDTVEIKGGGDAVSAAQAVFETGDVDFAWNLQVQKAVLEQIMQGGNATLDAPLGPNVERIEFNFANPDPLLGDKRSEPDQPHPFLTDIRVRQALSLAIDRKTMAEQLYGPLGDPTCNILTAPPEYVSSNTSCEQDIEKAKQLLDEAGWKDNGSGVREKDGKQLVLSFQTSINALRQSEQALVKQDWAKIGVQANLRAIDGGVFFGSDAGNPDNFGHFFADVEMYTSSPDSPVPTIYFDGWTCAQIAQKSNGWNLNNNNRYCNKEYDAMVAQVRTESDPAKRKELFIKLNDHIVNNYVNIPLIARRTTPNAYSKALQGPKNNPWDSSLWNIAEWHK